MKLGMYADDIVCYTGSPLILIKGLTTLLNTFGLISGYKINQDKSILTGFNVTEKMRTEISKILPGKWQENNIKYLGVRIERTNKEMIEENVIILINHLKGKCKKWTPYPLFISSDKDGTASLNVILDLPINLLNRIQGIINTFIWKDKQPRICSQIVEQQIENGGY